MLARVSVIQSHVGGFDRDFAALWQGVTRIDYQVHHDLLDLALVRLHASEPGVEIQRQVNILADQAGQHFSHVGQQNIQIQDGGRQDLLPAERQKLPRERSSALARLLNLLRMLELGFPPQIVSAIRN